MRPMLKAVLAAVILAVSFASPVAAGPFEDGNAAYDRKDYATALRFYRPLADQGHAEAQFNLGLMYGNGQGVPQNYVQGHMWFNLAAARFPASETENRNKAVSARANVASKMTPAQVAEAQKLAREWKPK